MSDVTTRRTRAVLSLAKVLRSSTSTRAVFRMSSAEVDTAFQSGRWDIQVHAHAGHVLIPAGVDADVYGWLADRSVSH
jgi:hypothetical protein